MRNMIIQLPFGENREQIEGTDILESFPWNRTICWEFNVLYFYGRVTAEAEWLFRGPRKTLLLRFFCSFCVRNLIQVMKFPKKEYLVNIRSSYFSKVKGASSSCLGEETQCV